MPGTVHSVSIGELVVSKNPEDSLVAYGLGSCVAVSMYDPVTKVAGMIHSLLPKAANANGGAKTPAKFVDEGIPRLVEAIQKAGGSKSRVIVYLCGGAQMLAAPGFKNSLNIGERNVDTAESILRASGFRIQARSTGGNSGRTVRMQVATGELTVKTLGEGEKTLSSPMLKVS
ncbi:MAG: chemotaxis protein CheD [Anaerolineae bacterium]